MLSRRGHQPEQAFDKRRGDSLAEGAERPSLRDDLTRDDSDHVIGNHPVMVPTAKPTTPAAIAPDAPNTVTFCLRRTDQLLLGFLLIALLILLAAFRWKLSGGGRTEIEIVSQQPREYYYSIDINRASWVEWAQLDGIGEKLGRRIVQDREEHGPFTSVDEIRRVRGFGPKLIEKLRPFLKCTNEADPEPI